MTATPHVQVSYMELYNEELTDLLSLNDSDTDKRLRLLEDRSGVVVQGLEEMVVKSAAGEESYGFKPQDTRPIAAALDGRCWGSQKATTANLIATCRVNSHRQS